MRLEFGLCVLFAAAQTACGGSSTTGSSDLSGMWDLTLGAGSGYSGGTATVTAQGISVIAVAAGLPVQSPGGNCALTLSQSEVNMSLSADESSLSGTVDHAQQYTGPDCISLGAPAGVARNPLWSFTMTRTAAAASNFGAYGGTWTFTGSTGEQCTLIFEGSSFSGKCTDYSFTGSGTSTLISGQDDEDVAFSAQRQ